MVCPKCGQEMTRYKEESTYSRRKLIEYRRTYYHCEQDDVWGSLEIPIGPMHIPAEELQPPEQKRSNS